MIIDGNSVWGADTQAGMIQKVIAGFKAIDTFPGLPDNLYEALENSAARWPDKTAIVDNYGKEYTYQQFLAYSEEFAAYLNGEKNIRPGSHVGDIDVQLRGILYCFSCIVQARGSCSAASQ